MGALWLGCRRCPWVGIAHFSPLLGRDCPGAMAGSRQSCLLCSCPCLFFSAADVLVPDLYWATIAHRASLLLVIIFPPDFIFNVTGAMMMAVFFPPAVIIGTSEELK